MARSNKTKQVMRLVTGVKPQDVKEYEGEDFGEPVKKLKKAITQKLDPSRIIQDVPENPVIRNIAIRSHKHYPEKTPQVLRALEEKRLINIPTMLMEEQFDIAIKRYNICSCQKCLDFITEKALKDLPNKFLKINNSDDADELMALLEEFRPILVKTLSKLCITARAKPYHTETDL